MNKDKIDVFAHRAGFYKEGETGPGAENTFERAEHSLRFVDGLEIDVDFTSDGVAVVTHSKLNKKSEDGKSQRINFEEFKQKFPKHATLESWLDWFAQDGMESRKLYLDLKGTDQDAFQLLELVQQKGLEGRVYIGSKDARTMVKMLLARKSLNLDAKIFLQIPDPSNPEKAVSYARSILEQLGVSEPELMNLKPDGLHFFWPENLIKDMISELVQHGEFVPVTDRSVKVPWYKRFPNIPFFHNLQRRRLREFIEESQKAGYEVMAGSAGSPSTMQRMIEWGVRGIMPNVPDRVPDSVKREPLPIGSIPKPKGQFANNASLWDVGTRLRNLEADSDAEQQYYNWVHAVPDFQENPSGKEKVESTFGGIPSIGLRLRQWWRDRRKAA